jgi:hypothetical protein
MDDVRVSLCRFSFGGQEDISLRTLGFPDRRSFFGSNGSGILGCLVPGAYCLILWSSSLRVFFLKPAAHIWDHSLKLDYLIINYDRVNSVLKQL